LKAVSAQEPAAARIYLDRRQPDLSRCAGAPAKFDHSQTNKFSTCKAVTRLGLPSL